MTFPPGASMKIIRPMKITLFLACTTLWVTLLSGPSFAQSHVASLSETVYASWESPFLSDEVTLPEPSCSEEAEPFAMVPLEFVQEASLQSSPGFIPSSPPERTIILWEAQKTQGSPSPERSEPDKSLDTEGEEEFAEETIPDPLEPVNRLFFHFNDKLYYWLLKPVATAYKAVLPQAVRVSVSNFFSNLTTPIRVANCILQGDVDAAGNETARFMWNTTVEALGLFDPAKSMCKINKDDRDLGQTFGKWGINSGFYIEWPVLGPSSVRDTFGFVGDFFLDPKTYVSYVYDHPITYAIRPFEIVNETSLRLGEYEDFKKMAVDPYVAKRDGYYQYRQNKINKVKKK